MATVEGERSAFPMLRLCIAAVSAALLLAGGVLLWEGFRLRSTCFEAETTQVLDIAVDVGAPGRRRATLKQIAAFTCRQYIRIEPKLPVGDDIEAQLRDLELIVSVQDAGGVTWMTGTFPSHVLERGGKDGITIADAAPMPVGEYSVLIDVVTPAPALAGRPIRLVSGYTLCGIEWMGPTAGIGGGALAAAVGAIIGGMLLATRGKSPNHESSR